MLVISVFIGLVGSCVGRLIFQNCLTLKSFLYENKSLKERNEELKNGILSERRIMCT
jgi:hypothetical protein